MFFEETLPQLLINMSRLLFPSHPEIFTREVTTLSNLVVIRLTEAEIHHFPFVRWPHMTLRFKSHVTLWKLQVCQVWNHKPCWIGARMPFYVTWIHLTKELFDFVDYPTARSHCPVIFGGNRHSGGGNIFFICHVTSREYLISSHYLVKFGGHRPCEIGDKTFFIHYVVIVPCCYCGSILILISHHLVKFSIRRAPEIGYRIFPICHMTACDHVINGLCGFKSPPCQL